MLRLLQLVEQLIGLERRQEEGWTDLTLQLTLADESQVARATELLAPSAPARLGSKIRFGITRTGNEIGLSRQQLEALLPAEHQAREAAAARKLREAGAHYLAGSLPEAGGRAGYPAR